MDSVFWPIESAIHYGFSPELLRHQHISGFSIKLVQLRQPVCLVGLVYSEDLPDSASKNVGKAALKAAGMKAILHLTTILSDLAQKSGTKAGHNAAEPSKKIKMSRTVIVLI